jgi:hypothetical protein
LIGVDVGMFENVVLFWVGNSEVEVDEATEGAGSEVFYAVGGQVWVVDEF